MKHFDKILITGSNGLIGSELTQILNKNGFSNLLIPKRSDLDLTIQSDVYDYFNEQKPDFVFHLAAKVGGIKANSELPSQFIYENTIMQLNVLDASYKNNVKKILIPGSACTYPKHANQPVSEEMLFSGFIEPTNIAYATAKLNGIIAAQSYSKQYGMNVVIPMPTNSYGINDHFDIENSHVIPAMIMKFHKAKLNKDTKLEIWGSGKPMREFIYSSDLADAILFLMKNYNSNEIINVGTMEEITIFELALLIKDIVGFDGKIECNTNKPDGIMRKCLDSKKLFSMGWKHKTSLKQGISNVYEKFTERTLIST